jgi:CheY-like chemotaxis protein
VLAWLTSALSTVKREVPPDDEPRFPYVVVVAIPVASLAAIVFYAWGDWDRLAVAWLVAGGAFVGGGLLGFLFGIPRSLAGREGARDAADAGEYSPNTNLEQISDWLTKILVGVGLVQFTILAQHAGELVEFLGPAFGGAPLGETFAGATLVIFSISGFLAFYLVTRISLPGAFAHADRNARDIAALKRAATVYLAHAARDASPRVGGAPVDRKDIAEVVERASAVTASMGPQRILWVDDRPQNNLREQNAMTALGMQVTSATSTKEALDRLDESSFDVVITDMGRPGNPQAGYELLKKMQARNDTTPVIIYSSSDRPEHKEQAKKMGAFGTTNRPDELVDLVVKAVK